MLLQIITIFLVKNLHYFQRNIIVKICLVKKGTKMIFVVGTGLMNQKRVSYLWFSLLFCLRKFSSLMIIGF